MGASGSPGGVVAAALALSKGNSVFCVWRVKDEIRLKVTQTRKREKAFSYSLTYLEKVVRRRKMFFSACIGNNIKKGVKRGQKSSKTPRCGNQ